MYEWQERGVKIADEAKLLLSNGGWELVEVVPEERVLHLLTGDYSTVKLKLKMRKIAI